MSPSSTTTVEIDRALLQRLRKRRPAQSDRELIERVVRIQLGFEAMRRLQERNAAADVNEDEVMAEAVRGVKETRREMAAERAQRDAA